MKPVAFVPILTSLALLACGTPTSTSVLSQAAEHMRDIKSADMNLRVTAATRDGQAVGFLLAGPFATANSGLPVARVAYTELGGDQQKSFDFVSTGSQAYIGSGGKFYRLSEQQTRPVRTGGGSSGSSGLTQLRLDRWMVDPKLSDGGKVDGVGVDRVTARLRPFYVIQDLVAMSSGFGVQQPNGVPKLDSTDQQTIERAVRSSHIEVLSGHDDHMLRRVSLAMEFVAGGGPSVQSGLGDVGALSFHLDLALKSLNVAVSVGDPPGALPFSSYRPS